MTHDEEQSDTERKLALQAFEGLKALEVGGYPTLIGEALIEWCKVGLFPIPDPFVATHMVLNGATVALGRKPTADDFRGKPLDSLIALLREPTRHP
jgi:hypothetical protein